MSTEARRRRPAGDGRPRDPKKPHGVSPASSTTRAPRPRPVEDGPASVPTPTPARRSHTALLVVCLAVFVDMLGFGIILPSLPYRAAQLGGAGVWVGAILTAYAVAQFVAAPVLGSLSDRYGRRRLLLFSLAGSAIALALAGLAGTLVLLLAARFVAGGFGGSIAVGQAYAVDLTPAKDRTRALGMVGASIGLGFVFGPGIGGGLAAAGLGFTGISLIAAGIAVVNLILGVRLLPRRTAEPVEEPAAESATAPRSKRPARTSDAAVAGNTRKAAVRAAKATSHVDRRGAKAAKGTVGAPESRGLTAAVNAVRSAVNGVRTAPRQRLATLGEALRLRSLRPILLAGFAATFAFAGMETTFALLGQHRFGIGPAGFGAVFAGVGIVMALVQGGLVGRLTDKYGDRGVAVAGAAALGIGLVVLPFAPAWLAYLALAVVGVGQGLLTTTTAALITVRGGHRIGGSLGVGQSASAAARALGPIVAGLTFDLRPGLPYLIGGVLCGGAALLLSRSGEAAIAPVPVATFTVDSVA